MACGHGHLEGPETAQKCEALWMLRIPGRGVNVGGGPIATASTACPPPLCLLPLRAGAWSLPGILPQGRGPREPPQPWVAPDGIRTLLLPKNGIRAQDGLSWARSVLRTGLTNRTSFPKLRKGLEINAGEGCRLPRVDRGWPARCPVARSASLALSQPFPRCGWGLGGSSGGRSVAEGGVGRGPARGAWRRGT